MRLHFRAASSPPRLVRAVPLLALLLWWAPVAAQEQLFVTFDERRGWLGLEIRFERQERSDAPNSPRERLMIEGVVPGSPAEEAGVLAGDGLVEIDGAPASRRELRELERNLEPGATVELLVDRAGKTLSLSLEATEPPEDLRRRAVTRVRVRRSRSGDEPLDVLIDVDSLRSQIEAINLERLADVRRRLDSVRTELDEEREEALREVREAGREALDAARRLSEEVRIEIDPLPGLQDWPRDWGASLTYGPLILGGRVVAGTELADLNPSLGRYFGVSVGVLVTDVIRRSPAAEGGLEPGDVIVAMDGEEVASVAEIRELRSRLSFERFWRQDPETAEPDGVPITVIRDGERLELLLLR